MNRRGFSINRGTLTIVSAAVLCVTAVWMSLAARKVSAQTASANSAIYNPYPPGILPADLNPEDVRALPGRNDRKGRLLAYA